MKIEVLINFQSLLNSAYMLFFQTILISMFWFKSSFDNPE